MHSELRKAEEDGYRRGFDQGMYVTIKMFEEGKSLEEMRKIKARVRKWRYNGKYGPKNDIRIDPPVKF